MAGRVVLAGVGDLNRRVARRFLDRGGEVVGLRRSSPDADLGFEQHSLDLATQVWPDLDADWVVMALSAPERTAEGYRQGYVEPVNRLRESLDRWRRMPSRVVVVGSSRVYGVDDGRELTEDSPIEPADWAGEQLAEMEAEVDALPVPSTVARLSGIYGPGRDWLRRMARSLEEKPPKRNHWTNRIHIEDAASALAHVVLDAPFAERYLVTDRCPVPLYDVLSYLREREGLPAIDSVPPVGGGKRLLSDRLASTGFEWQFPDYRAGGYR
ncbi:NAD-dependent epimerase/dehydratase family protein [Saccharospirillum salsuginis]|uniref:NAD-dependent epimerase/dehydratase domain-containing protein n=1 Tax=Saccharospirillum salsuginis TaxID=418750 RepID=A0A918K1F6_9GAMM|nr:NAD-dependent epimerase/dehydratase family protein [Saccharospirillum salsuginis]GGX43999.1 hypothetical protein GCM10007392_08450 [Saccharospirillum salsuginis]